MSKKQLKGRIDYLITISEDGMVNTDYVTSAENDIAAFAIAHKIMYSEIGHFKARRDSITGFSPTEKKNKLFFGGVVNAMRDGIKGCTRMLDMLLQNYDGFKEEQAKIEALKEEKHKKIMEYFKDNKITIENGKIGKEEVDKLLKDSRFKDMAASHEEINDAVNKAQEEIINNKFEVESGDETKGN